MTVADLEAAINSVHATAITSDVCGWDQFMDFHFGVATWNWRSLDEVIPQIQALGRKFHTGTSTWHPAGSTLMTLFAMTPNGISVQLHNMAQGTYVPSAPSVHGHAGLCSIGPPSCTSESAAVS
uniref:Uncharacterized protein n=1 Tax=Haptolina ericina TaxID=156174 RepID=A0A7S3AE06_9EUKA